MSKKALIAKLHETFPDTVQTGMVSRAQIMQVTSYIPTWLVENKVGRGLYAISTKQTAAPAVPVQQMSVAVDYTNIEAQIPARDLNFVPFGNYDDLFTIIQRKLFNPAYVSGPTGNGKSTMVEQICAKLRRPLIRVNLNLMSDEEQLIGSKTLKDGNIEIVEGPVLIAMRTGSILLIDEIDGGGANALLCLQSVLEGKPYYFKLKNEIITPAPGFNIIATANTKGKGSEDGRYIGTNVLNEAFLERFAVTFEQDYPSAKIEEKIILKLMESLDCVDEKFAETLIKWADAIRRTFNDGGVDENITTRRMIHIVKQFAIFRNQKKAIELCCNRFDKSTKDAFLDLFTKICEPETAAEVVAEEVQENNDTF